MKLICISNPIQLLSGKCLDEVHLFTQFFIPSNKERHAELKQCLKLNSMNSNVHTIHLLVERKYSVNELGTPSHKVIQTVIGKRLTFQDVFVYIRARQIRGYLVLLNSDICFADSALPNMRRSELHVKKQSIALLRYEYNPEYPESSLMFGPRFDSQDTWIFHSNHVVSPSAEHIFNFEFGRPGCDNKIIYLLSILGYEVINDPRCIQTYHIHTSKQRSYSMKDSLKLPCGVIVPYGVDPFQINSNLGIHMRDVHRSTKGFRELMFTDNQALFDYIQERFKRNAHFILPRISGIENNVAVFARVIRDKLHSDLEPLRKYIQKTLNAMKNNAGILLESDAETSHYSDAYLSAIEHCEMMAGWDVQGNYIGHIAQSHAYLRNVYPTKKMFWALSLDIFHYIYNNPWTHALRGKRILIISPFEESILEKLPVRSKLYHGIDLFPDCEFITMKPPQTQAGEPSRGFTVEFQEFKENVDRLIDSFDIALVSCGGYANPICSFIYEKGKSAIYVGGVLQMYFGILGERWVQERNDAVRLFHNKYWSRPKENERPRDCKKIEGGCYW
jgi:hypothetical protein